jgi:hypothetical protein
MPSRALLRLSPPSQSYKTHWIIWNALPTVCCFFFYPLDFSFLSGESKDRNDWDWLLFCTGRLIQGQVGLVACHTESRHCLIRRGMLLEILSWSTLISRFNDAANLRKYLDSSRYPDENVRTVALYQYLQFIPSIEDSPSFIFYLCWTIGW